MEMSDYTPHRPSVILTPEEIAEKTNHLSGIANIRAINKLFRQQDSSCLWPILSKFNITERVIRRTKKYDCKVYGLEYAYLLDSLMSSIVNDPKNR